MTDLVIISGASRGLGAALAEAVPFPAQVIDISRSGNDASDVEHIEADLADPESWPEVGEAITTLVDESNPKRTTFIHAAGALTPIGFAGEVDANRYTQNVLLNSGAGQVLGHHYLNAVAGRNGRHDLVMISSGAATSAYAGWSSYGAAKAAMDQWVRTVGKEQELRGGVNVAAIAPSVVATEMQAEIRNTDERHFPEVERFMALHKNDNLLSPRESARKVWQIIENGFENGAVLDIRDLS